MSKRAKGCSCIEYINEVLEEDNTALETGFSLDFDSGKSQMFVYVGTRKIDPRKRGKARSVAATYCPFCGKKVPNLK